MRVILFFLLFSPVIIYAQTNIYDLKSKHTGDTYKIYIRKPLKYDSTRSYHVVFFPDATINSGKEILHLPEESIKNCILVGVGHIGDWKMKRQRDFIPSDNGGYSNSEFGKASNFYLFVKNELMLFVNSKVKKASSRIFIGHSFGGLIAIYMSMRENKLFDHYYAISPSIWANKYELEKMEKQYAQKSKEYKSKITLYAGSLEFLNKVLSSTNEFYNTVSGRNYKGLTISKNIVDGVNHYGIIPAIIPQIFSEIGATGGNKK